jgi:glutamyl-Q tRNA(Asp) synthetase
MPDQRKPCGRFAPSPTGPLHLGSLVAAVGAWLFARRAGGVFLVRLEDLDAARVVPGSADEILRAIALYGLTPDGPVAVQSRRAALYEAAIETLRGKNLVYPCACTRSKLARIASAPLPGDAADSGPAYPGTCRGGLPAGRSPRSLRFRVSPGEVSFDDAVLGRQTQDVAHDVGDFVVRRADGPFAYQLAVVVDDAEQGVTQVVRGADLLSSTPRQIALARALDLDIPSYAHLPLVVGPHGAKLGKRDGALPLATLDERRLRETLAAALSLLGQEPADAAPREMLEEALRRFDPARIPRGPVAFGRGGRFATGGREISKRELP